MLKSNKYILMFVFAIMLLATGIRTASSVGAFPGVVTITQPDGSKFKAQVHGDEFFSYHTTVSGYSIAMAKDGFYYYASYNADKTVISSVKVSSGDLGAFGFTKGISQDVVYNRRMNAIQERNQFAFFNDKAVAKFTKGGTVNTPPRGLVILVDYPDKSFVTPNPAAAFGNLMNQKGYSVNGAKGSVADYFEQNSMGAYRPEFDVIGPFTVSNPSEYYGNHNGNLSIYRVKEMLREVCTKADGTVDYTKYDADGDGFVDMVLVYYAGHNAAEGDEKAIWPHMSALPRYTGDGKDASNVDKNALVLDGKVVCVFACSSELRSYEGAEMTGIATMSHEFSHVLGFADEYDVDGAVRGLSAALWGSLSIMDVGTYNYAGHVPPLMTSYQRQMAGWLTPIKITESGTYTLSKLDLNQAYIIETDAPGEVFYLENRQSTGWDEYLNWNIWLEQGGVLGPKPKGLVIVHVDLSNNIVADKYSAEQLFLMNWPNVHSYHQCIDLVEACGYETYPNNRYPLADAFFPGTKNVTQITPITTPALSQWNRKNLGVQITNIRLEGEDVKFDVIYNKVDKEKALVVSDVVDHRGNILSGAKVNFYTSNPAQESSPKGQAYFAAFAKFTKAASPIFTATTNIFGKFEAINLAPGTYYVEVEKENLSILNTTLTIAKGENKTMLVMMPRSNDPEMGILKWHNNVSAYGVGADRHGTALHVGTLFTKELLAKYPKNNISSVVVRNFNKNGAKLTVIMGGKEIASKAITSATPGSDIIFDLSEFNIVKDNTKDLMIAVMFEGYTQPDYAIGFDTSVCVPGVSDLISTNGVNWVSTAERDGAKGSYMISVILAENVTAPFPALNLSKTGYKVGDELLPDLKNAVENGVKEISYTVNGTTVAQGGVYKFTTAGNHVLVASYKKANGKVEKIVKTIVVQ